jgi:hypothetical protein
MIQATVHAITNLAIISKKTGTFPQVCPPSTTHQVIETITVK